MYSFAVPNFFKRKKSGEKHDRSDTNGHRSSRVSWKWRYIQREIRKSEDSSTTTAEGTSITKDKKWRRCHNNNMFTRRTRGKQSTEKQNPKIGTICCDITVSTFCIRSQFQLKCSRGRICSSRTLKTNSWKSSQRKYTSKAESSSSIWGSSPHGTFGKGNLFSGKRENAIRWDWPETYNLYITKVISGYFEWITNDSGKKYFHICCSTFQTIKTQQEQIDFLRKENSTLGEELHKLKCEAASLPEEKDAELLRLRKEISHLQRSKETQVGIKSDGHVKLNYNHNRNKLYPLSNLSVYHLDTFRMSCVSLYQMNLSVFDRGWKKLPTCVSIWQENWTKRENKVYQTRSKLHPKNLYSG